MQDVGILADTIHMDTPTEKVPFNKLSIVAFSFLIITLIVWLPLILLMIGCEGKFSEYLGNIINKLSSGLIYVLLLAPLMTFVLSILALVQIERSKERGMVLNIISLVSVILLFWKFFDKTWHMPK